MSQPADPGGQRWLRAGIATVWCVTAVLLALGAWQLQVHQRQSEAVALTRAAHDLGNLTRTSQVLADRSVHEIDQIIRFGF